MTGIASTEVTKAVSTSCSGYTHSRIAVGFSFVEQVLQAPEQDIAVASALSLLESNTEWLDAVGFQKLVYEDFYEVLYNLVESIAKPHDGATLTVRRLLEAFQVPESTSIRCV